MGTLKVLFLEDGGQEPESVARWLAEIVNAARSSIRLAIYDARLQGESADILVGALQARARAGVKVRIVYNAPRAVPPGGEVVEPGHPDDTGTFLASTRLPVRAVGDGASGSNLMHHKYLVIDAGTPAGRLYTGSANFTMAAFAHQENNLLDISSPELSARYASNFEQLWRTGSIVRSGANDGSTVLADYEGEPAEVRLRFAPGEGTAIDREVANRIRAAKHDLTIASAVVSSGHILGALRETAERGVPIRGIVDMSQMSGILTRWHETPNSAWKAETFEMLARYGNLHGKRSAHASVAHSYMHNKVMVIDDTVITGSYNFSINAESNAENILFIESPALARTYRTYIGRLLLRYPRLVTKPPGGAAA